MHFVLLVLFLTTIFLHIQYMLVFAPVLGCLTWWRDRCEDLEQWMTNGVTMETVQDGRNVVCSASHLTALIAYSSYSLHKHTTPFTPMTSLKEQLLLCVYTICPTCVCDLLITQPCSVEWHPRTEMNFKSGPYLK